MYPDSDPNHSQNLMGSKLDQDPSSILPISSICLILQTDKQSAIKIIPPWWK